LGGLKIQKHAKLFERAPREPLRFVNEQYRGLARAVTVLQPTLKMRQRCSALGIKRHTEIGQDQIEQFAGLYMRIVNECFGDALLLEPLHQAIEQNGLARADFAGEQ